jgi:hypothetical protein
VRRFRNKSKSFTWTPRTRRERRALKSGYYVARFSSKSPNGRRDVRSVAVRRADGKFRKLRLFERAYPCALLERFNVDRPVFARGRKVRIRFRLSEAAGVTVDVRRKGKRVKRFKGDYAANRTHTVRYRPGKGGIGDYRVVLRAEHPGRTSQAVVVTRRLR